MNTTFAYHNYQASPFQSQGCPCPSHNQMVFMMMQKMQMAMQMILAGFQGMQLAPSGFPGMAQNPGFGSPLSGFLGSPVGNASMPMTPGPSGGGGYTGAPVSSPSTGATPAPAGPVDSSIGQPNQSVAQSLMRSIRNNPVPPRCSPGYCYRGVKHHLRQIGVNLTGGSAYMAADQLAATGRFREVRVERSQLRSLPAGAVVVWNRGNGRRHGHISIAMGDGREASDRVRRQIVNYPNSFRVFIPR